MARAKKKHKLDSKRVAGVRAETARQKGGSQGECARICAAVLKIAGEGGWSSVTLDNVAKGARVTLASVKKRAKTPNELVPLIVDGMTLEALAETASPSGDAHDALFELMMARFDVLQEHRAGVLAIADAARRDGALAVALGRAVFRSMSKTVEAAHFDLPSPPIMAAALAAVYGWAFFAWRRDKTLDMSKTMAALDRALKLVGKGVEIVKRGL
ncbi:MAG: hypothetical protein PHW76_10220 [Alphaproteobacteria bacterium]|nr:hypothetical protein [Alphaproteobacteria bacterium]